MHTIGAVLFDYEYYNVTASVNLTFQSGLEHYTNNDTCSFPNSYFASEKTGGVFDACEVKNVVSNFQDQNQTLVKQYLRHLKSSRQQTIIDAPLNYCVENHSNNKQEFNIDRLRGIDDYLDNRIIHCFSNNTIVKMPEGFVDFALQKISKPRFFKDGFKALSIYFSKFNTTSEKSPVLIENIQKVDCNFDEYQDTCFTIAKNFWFTAINDDEVIFPDELYNQFGKWFEKLHELGNKDLDVYIIPLIAKAMLKDSYVPNEEAFRTSTVSPLVTTTLTSC